MEANSVSELLFSKYGKKWHFITPDYAFGHTLQDACAGDLKKLGGTVTGNELTPLGTTDFSAYLIKARAANPDVLLLLVQGSDMVNCLKQIVQFGLNKQIHVAGTQQELESLAGAAAGGAHRHLDVRVVLETAGRSRRRQVRRRYPQGQWRQGADRAALVRLRFGDDALPWSPTGRRRSTRSSSQRRSENFELPADVKLQPNKCYYRKGDHQLMTSAFVGEAQSKGKDDPEDLFRVDEVVPGDKTAPP